MSRKNDRCRATESGIRGIGLISRSLGYGLILACLLMPMLASALGVGELSVRSHLNEPLDASIALIYSDSDEATGAVAQMATAEDFARVGIDPSQVPAGITMNVVRNTSGNFEIQIRSASPIREPIVTLLIEVQWASGKLLREYPIFLDPPVSPPRRDAVEVAPMTDSQTSEVSPADSSSPSSTPSSTPTFTPSSGRTISSDEYEVRSGDTLWEIARDARPSDSVTVNQMMVAIHRMNSQAFYQDNINALRAGAILRVPDQSQVDALSRNEADRAVASQNSSWQGTPGTNVPTVSDAGADAEYDYADSSTDPSSTDSRLELVPAGNSSDSDTDRPGSGGDSAALREDLARTREELISAQSEGRELEDRVQELESLVSNMERALNVKDADLSDLQAQLRLSRENAASVDAGSEIDSDPFMADSEDPDQTESPADPFESDVDPFETDVDDGQTDDALLADGDVDAVYDPLADAGDATDSDAYDPFATPVDDPGTDADVSRADDPFAVDLDSGEADDESPTTAAIDDGTADDEVTTAVDADVVDADSVDDGEGMSLLTLLIIGLVVLGLIAVVLWFLRQRSSSGSDELFVDVDDDDDLVAVDTDGDGDVDEVVAVDRDYSESATESDLKAALLDDPNDPQAHLGLLRKYYAAEDRERYVVQAQLMSEHVGATHPAWGEARAMGSKLAPDEPLFGADADPALSTAETQVMSADMLTSGMQPQVDDDDDLDLDLGDLDLDGDTRDMPSVGNDDDDDLDFDLDSVDDSAASADDDLDLDFDLDLDDDLSPEKAAADDGLDDLDLDLDLDDGLDTAEPATGRDDLDLDLDLDLSEPDVQDDDDFDLDDLDLDFDTGEEPALDLDTAETELPAMDRSGDEPTAFEMEAVGHDDSDRGSMDTAELSIDFDDADDAHASEEVPDLDDLDLDDLDLSDTSLDGDDAAGTKLDLARAYIDMGDSDGARGMLDEVVSDGSEEQRAEARELLGKLDD